MLSAALKNAVKKSWLIPVAVSVPVTAAVYFQHHQAILPTFLLALLTGSVAMLLATTPLEYAKIKQQHQK